MVFFKTKPLLVAVKKVPITSLNAILLIRLLTKEWEASSYISVPGVHTENGPLSKRTSFKFMSFCLHFRNAPFSQWSNVNAMPERISFTPFSYEKGAL